MVMNWGCEKLWTAVADLFLPRLCCVCGTNLGRHERYICLNCLADMPLTHSWSLVRNPMAEHFNALIERMENESLSLNFCEASLSDGLLEREAEDPTKSCYEHYVYAAALFNFVKDGGYRNITYRLKYSRNIKKKHFFTTILNKQITTTK